MQRPAARSGRAPYLAKISALRRRTADGIEDIAADEEVEVGAIRPEGVVARGADFRASLPPAMLADRHSGIEVCIEARAGSHTALRRFDRNPVALANPARLRRLG